MTEKEALKLALDAFGEIAWSNETQWQRDRAKEAITAIKEALAQPEQEPVAWIPITEWRWNNNAGTWEGLTITSPPAQQQEQKLEFVSPGGGYVPAIPKPIPLDWKLVPRKATPEMLRAMDECAQEGYDERLYEGMASSVYMAAWDASPVLGTLPPSEKERSMMDIIVGNLVREGINKHRARELAEHFIKQCNYTNGYCTGRIDLLAEQKAQQRINCKSKRDNNGVCPHHNLQCGWPKCNESEQPAQQQEPVAWATQMGDYAHFHWGAKRPEYPVAYEIPLYTTPPQRTWVGLTDEEKDGKRVFENGLLFNTAEVQVWELAVQWAEAKLKEKNEQ